MKVSATVFLTDGDEMHLSLSLYLPFELAESRMQPPSANSDRSQISRSVVACRLVQRHLSQMGEI